MPNTGPHDKNKGQPIIKKPKLVTTQHQRPSSPGINGKVAEAPYKPVAKSLKSNN